MNYFWKALRFCGIVALICLGLIFMTNDLLMPRALGGYHLLLFRLISGFCFFLWENLPVISWDAGTWGPGLGAFLLAMVMVHLFLRKRFVEKNRHWSFTSTFCLMSLLPVLFAISFIVPGVLLQWELLRQVAWFEMW